MRQVRRVGGLIVQVDARGEVVWCDDWGALLQLALRGYTNVKPGPRGEIMWVDG
jgi:hypothetical protein